MSEVQRFFRRHQLPEVTGYNISHLYKMIREGKFPAPVKMGVNRSAWLESDIVAWQRARIAASKNT